MSIDSASILWHDYETTGTDPARDRPVQYAAQRTDLDLNPIEDPQILFCRPVEDVLPHPQATLVTGITPQQALREGLPEPEFIGRIEAQMARSGTCVAGYNSIRFDDEVTRYSLYRNFYDPYAREWRNGNSRWDIIDMVRLVYALKPESLSWPEREPGVPSFKLEFLTHANGIGHQAAHDALSDVQATIALARMIREREPALYDYCWKLRVKDYVLQQLHLGESRPLLHVSSRFPARQGCLAIVLPLQRLRSNPNAVVVLDLQTDPGELQGLDVETIHQRVFTAQDELPDGQSRLPLKLLHLNRTPIIAPVALLSEQRAGQLGIDRALCERHWQQLGDLAGVKSKLEAVFAPQDRPADDAETALYRGFVSDADRLICDQVRAADADALAGQSFPFADARLVELLFRYRARFYPEGLDAAEKSLWEEQVRQRLLRDDSGDFRCLTGYFRLVDQLRSEAAGDARQLALLDALKTWGQELQQKYSQA